MNISTIVRRVDYQNPRDAEALVMLLNAYAERISGAALSSLMLSKLPSRPGVIDWGELTLVEQAADRQIGMSFYGRWSA